MRPVLFVLAFILILFGLSLWYYRSSPEGGFSLPKIGLPFFKAPGSTEEKDSGKTLSEKESYKSLEIVEGGSGVLPVGKSRVFFAIGKTENDGSISVNGNWYLSDNSLGKIDSSQGTETNFLSGKEGKLKLIVSYQNLKAEREIEVVGSSSLVGVSVPPKPSPSTAFRTSPTPTMTPAPTAVPVRAASPTPTPNPLKVVAVNIYDADGRRIVVGDKRTYVGKVLYSDGREKDLAVDWLLSADLGTLSRAQGGSTDFKALKPGSGTLKASYQGISSSLSIRVD